MTQKPAMMPNEQLAERTPMTSTPEERIFFLMNILRENICDMQQAQQNIKNNYLVAAGDILQVSIQRAERTLKGENI